jgi:hypothetical protein
LTFVTATLAVINPLLPLNIVAVILLQYFSQSRVYPGVFQKLFRRKATVFINAKHALMAGFGVISISVATRGGATVSRLINTDIAMLWRAIKWEGDDACFIKVI